MKKKGANITDLVSFYQLPSSILGHEKYDKLWAAYSYYNVAGSLSWQTLMHEVGSSSHAVIVFLVGRLLSCTRYR